MIRMASEGVLPIVGMQITGHKSEGAYHRYDRSVETRVQSPLEITSRIILFK